MISKEYEYIEEDHGSYYIKGTRITVDNVIHCLSIESTTQEDLSESWDVPIESIREAIDIHKEYHDSSGQSRFDTVGDSKGDSDE